MDDLTQVALAARDGDRVALTILVRRSQPDVWRYCAHFGSRGDADDLTQEVFIRAIPALASFRGESSVRTWLLTIARRTCAESVGRAVRYRRLLQRVVVRESAIEPAPSGSVELDQLVAALDKDRRAAFVLTQVLGFSYEEAAEACECPVGTIRSRVARARAELVRAVQGLEVPPPQRRDPVGG